MPRYFIIMVLLTIATLAGNAQQIRRKGGLGVGFYQKMPDTLISRLGYAHGAIVQFVVPGTTAATLGLLTDDIITHINGRLISSPADLLQAAKQLRDKEEVVVSIIRNKKKSQVKGRVVPRPLEQSAGAKTVYGEFAYKQGFIRTIYKKPETGTPVGTIYFLQGISCYSLDNLGPQDMTKQAIDAMVARGFAVYRMEKADMGDNVNMPPCEQIGFNEELEMYKAGYRNLLLQPGIDTSRIILFGHSMGGITVPLLTAIHQPKAIVVYGTVFKSWMEYLFDVFVWQRHLYGENLALLQAKLEKIKPFAYDYFQGKKTIEEIIRSTEGREAMDLLLNYEPKTGLAAAGRTPAFHKELSQQALSTAWEHRKGHVLAIYGECDIAAIRPDDHQELIRYINRHHPGKGTFWLAPGTTHTFEEIGTMKAFVDWQSNPAAYAQYAATRFNAKVFDYACKWMKEVLVKE